MITASEAMARLTSSWVIAPTPRPITRRLTSSPTSSWSSASSRASTEPDTSPLMMSSSSSRSPALNADSRSSSVTLGELGDALARLPALGDLPGHPVVGDDEEVVARVGHGGQAEHLDRTGRQGLGDGLVVLVQHGPDPAERLAAHDRVTDVQRAALHQNGGHRAAALVQVRLDGH